MRTTQLQYEIMVDFMETNGDLSKPSAGPRGRSFIQAKWKELTIRLNSEGSGDPRSEEKWRKVMEECSNGAEAQAATVPEVVSIDDQDWNMPGTSSEPTVFPPLHSTHEEASRSPTPPVTNPPLEEEECWKPPPAKKSKTNLIKMCLENDKKAREFAREREIIYDNMERERLELRREELRVREMEVRERVRQRDAELLLQAQWMELMKEAMNVLQNYIVKKD